MRIEEKTNIEKKASHVHEQTPHTSNRSKEAGPEGSDVFVKVPFGEGAPIPDGRTVRQTVKVEGKQLSVIGVRLNLHHDDFSKLRIDVTDAERHTYRLTKKDLSELENDKPVELLVSGLSGEPGTWRVRIADLDRRKIDHGTIHDVELHFKAGATPVERIDLDDIPPDIRERIAKAYVAYVAEKDLVPKHEGWHSRFGSGGTFWPNPITRAMDAPFEFMAFHAGLMNDFVRWLEAPARTNGEAELVGYFKAGFWDISKPLPKEFISDEIDQKDGQLLTRQVPGFLTPQGGGPSFTLRLADGSRKTIGSLEDIADPNELGAVLGMSGFHAVGHVELGGVMAGFASVKDPSFLWWHGGVIENGIMRDWLGTKNGQRWLETNEWPPEGHDHGRMDMGLRSIAPQFTEKSFTKELKRLSASFRTQFGGAT